MDQATKLRLRQQQASYVYKPEKWAYEQLKIEFDDWQKEAAAGFVEKHFSAWSTGSGVGKSALLSILIIWFLATRPFPRIGCTAPTQHQLYDVLWAEISKWLRRNEVLSKMFKWTATRVGLRGHEEEWFAVARTSKPRPGQTATEALQGFHADHILMVVDEASGVHDSNFAAVDGALTTEGAFGLMASNPTQRQGYFYRTITDPKQADVWDVKTVNAETAKFVKRKAIERVIKIWGKDSDYYRVKVRGLPPLGESSTLIRYEQITEAHTRIIEPPDDPAPIILSIDPARYGNDFCVFYVRQGWKIIDRRQVRGMKTTEIVKIAISLIDEYNPARIYVDDIGIGAGVVDQLQDHGELPRAMRKNVVGITIGSKPTKKNEKDFLNLRAEGYWYLRTAIDKLCIPFETLKLDEELTCIEYCWDSKDTKIKIESKDEIKKKLGRSPDDADALMLSFMSEILKGSVNVSPHYFAVGARDSENENEDEQSFEKELTLSEVGAKNIHSEGVGSMRYRRLEQRHSRFTPGVF